MPFSGSCLSSCGERERKKKKTLIPDITPVLKAYFGFRGLRLSILKHGSATRRYWLDGLSDTSTIDSSSGLKLRYW